MFAAPQRQPLLKLPARAPAPGAGRAPSARRTKAWLVASTIHSARPRGAHRPRKSRFVADQRQGAEQPRGGRPVAGRLAGHRKPRSRQRREAWPAEPADQRGERHVFPERHQLVLVVDRRGRAVGAVGARELNQSSRPSALAASRLIPRITVPCGAAAATSASIASPPTRRVSVSDQIGDVGPRLGRSARTADAAHRTRPAYPAATSGAARRSVAPAAPRPARPVLAGAAPGARRKPQPAATSADTSTTEPPAPTATPPIRVISHQRPGTQPERPDDGRLHPRSRRRRAAPRGSRSARSARATSASVSRQASTSAPAVPGPPNRPRRGERRAPGRRQSARHQHEQQRRPAVPLRIDEERLDELGPGSEEPGARSPPRANAARGEPAPASATGAGAAQERRSTGRTRAAGPAPAPRLRSPRARSRRGRRARGRATPDRARASLLRRFGGGRLRFALAPDAQPQALDLARVGVEHFEFVAVRMHHHLAAGRHPSREPKQQAAERVDLLGERRVGQPESRCRLRSPRGSMRAWAR